MIEIRLRANNDPNGEWLDEDWVEVTARVGVHNIDFDRAQVRIEDIIYTEDSEEFREHFKKAKFWLSLQDGL